MEKLGGACQRLAGEQSCHQGVLPDLRVIKLSSHPCILRGKVPQVQGEICEWWAAVATSDGRSRCSWQWHGSVLRA